MMRQVYDRLITRQRAVSWVVVMLLGAACGTGEETPVTPPGATRGYTACGSVTCQPGQYCAESMIGVCEPGCTSDLNCASNQTCADPDLGNVGTCENTRPACGNGTCEAGETVQNCAADCGSTGPVCGNGVCDGGEDDTSCPVDCGTAVDACKEECQAFDFFGCFEPGELQSCLDGCDAATTAQITQFWNCHGSTFCNCSCFDYLPFGGCSSSGPVCGNDVCEAGETVSNCPADCGSSGPVCGNGVCETSETTVTCSMDCASLVEACKDECDAYAFFDCDIPGGLQSCYYSCEVAYDSEITEFLDCYGSTFCDTGCFDYLL